MKSPVRKAPFSSAYCTLDVYAGVDRRIPILPPPSLIFIGGRKSECVRLPKDLTVGTEPQHSPFVFLFLKGPAIVTRSLEGGTVAKTSPNDAQLSASIRSLLPCHSPLFLGMTNIFGYSYHHSKGIQTQIVLGILKKTRNPVLRGKEA